MIEDCTLDAALVNARSGSEPDFTTIDDIKIAGCPARLIYGSVKSRSKWTADIEQLVSKEKLDLCNESPGAVLVIERSRGEIWAITWGTGFHFINTNQIDFSFARRIVARSAFSSELKSLTKTILDHRSRVDHSSIPGGSNIRELGVDGYGEVVSKIEGKGHIDGLTIGDKDIQLSAAQSLKIPLGKDPGALLDDLTVLNNLLQKDVVPGLESIEQLVALKPRDSRVNSLNQRLLDVLHSRKANVLGIAWPHERLDIHGPVMSLKVTGLGDRKRHVFEHMPDIDDIFNLISKIPRKNLLDRIRMIKLEVHSESEPQQDTLISTPVPLIRWLACELCENEQRFCLHDGQWYLMDDRYLARIDERVKDILAAAPSMQPPPWGDEPENDYNKQAAARLSGYCLDRKLIQTPLHSHNGIEPCDIFIPDGTLIHVKRARNSADLSHLLAQALVSTDALARDENARRSWRQRINDESGGEVKDAKLDEVILALGRKEKDPLSVENLFTFTKVNLVKQFDALRYLGVKVFITQV